MARPLLAAVATARRDRFRLIGRCSRAPSRLELESHSRFLLRVVRPWTYALQCTGTATFPLATTGDLDCLR